MISAYGRRSEDDLTHPRKAGEGFPEGRKAAFVLSSSYPDEHLMGICQTGDGYILGRRHTT